MKILKSKQVICLLVGLLVLALAAPAAVASERINLVVNGEQITGEVSIKEGVSFIDAQALKSIPNLDLNNQQGSIPVRQFFEAKGADVKWDGANNAVLVSWQYADKLVIKATEKQKEYNTYKMKGKSSMEMNIAGAEGVPQLPAMQVILEGSVQQEPLVVYIKQAVQMPWEEMGLTPEEAAALGGADMVTEMVLKADAMYQKMPMSEQWIVTDMSKMGMTESFTQMMQTTPQQSLEMMRKHGINNELLGKETIDGQNYYVIRNNLDSEAFKSLLEEMITQFNLGDMMTEVEHQEMMQLFANMELNYIIDSYINVDTMLTEHMNLEMLLKFTMDEEMSPEGAMTFVMKMNGKYQLFDFGLEISIPDVSNAIIQPIPEDAAGGQSRQLN